MSFVHLHTLSCYSMLRGAGSLDALLAAVRERGMDTVAVTDTDGLYGAVPFCQKAHEAGVRAVLGTELRTGQGAVTCLARSRTGYGNLGSLITQKKLRGDFDPVEALIEHQEGLYIFTDSIPLLDALAGAHSKRRIEPGALFAELIRYPRSGVHPRRTSRAQEDAAARLRLPVVATNHAAFVSPDDHATHRVLEAIRRNGLLSDLRPGDVAHREAWLKPADAMEALFQDRPDALRRTRIMAETCEFSPLSDRPVFPHCTLDAGETPFSRLWKLAFAGATRRYHPLTREVTERLRRELNVIQDLGFSEYFLITHDIVRFAYREGIPTVGRGSAADSLVAYCLGISAVDPIEHNLIFERFLNTLRPDCPDIDIDFCWRRRDEVIRYVYDRYGDDRVAMVANHNCFSARSAFRDVARVFGLSLDEVNRLSSVLPHYNAHSIRDAIRQWPEARDFPIDEEPCRSIVRIAERLDRFPRHLSVHVGGMVISDSLLTDYVPLERSTKGPVVCQYDKDGVEAVGLVKMDILAQRSLSIVADSARWVEELYGKPIRIKSLPPDDPKTAALLRRGDTMGCFQIESPGMRSLLRMMRAADRRDVIHGLSLIRPGPSGSGMKDCFVRRRRNLEPTRHLHPRLVEALGDTYGVMLYQEDTLRVAHAVAGFTLAEGDALRRAIKKGTDPRALQAMRRRFLTGAVERGGTREDAEALWQLINNFAAYSYCKAHATTYGYISYQASYIKARYPEVFLAAVLANEAGYYEARAYTEEARRYGVRILPPDVNRSDVTVRPERGAIRIGLNRVKGLTQRSVGSILSERERLPFASMIDFIARTCVSRSEGETLARCGALDCFGGTRPQLLWQAQLLFRDIKRLRGPQRRKPGTLNVFGGGPEDHAGLAELLALVPDMPPYPLSKRLDDELELLGLTVTAHPLAAYAERLRQVDALQIDALARHAGKRVAVAGWLVASRRTTTHDHQYMRFLTLEDLTGAVEVVLFPDVYQRDGHRVRSLGPYVAEGRVEDHYGSVALTCERLRTLDDVCPAETPEPKGYRKVS